MTASILIVIAMCIEITHPKKILTKLIILAAAIYLIMGNEINCMEHKKNIKNVIRIYSTPVPYTPSIKLPRKMANQRSMFNALKVIILNGRNKGSAIHLQNAYNRFIMYRSKV